MPYHQVLYMLLKIQVFFLIILILTANHFSDLYKTNDVSSEILAAAEQSSSPEHLLSLFYSSCSDILDSMALLKYKSPKLKITTIVRKYHPFT